MTKVLAALVFLGILGAVTIASVVQVARGDADWLAWVLLVVGPLALLAALGELRDAVRERR